MARPSIVLVSHVPPWPGAAGNTLRLNRLIKWLESTGFAAHLVYRPMQFPPPSEEDLVGLAQRYPNLYVVDAQHSTVIFATDDRRANDTLIGLPRRAKRDYERELPKSDADVLLHTIELTRSFAPDLLIDVVLALSDAVKPRAVIVEYVFMSRVLPFVSRPTLRIIDLIDVFSTKAAKVVRYGVDDSLVVSKAIEARLLSRADVAMAIQREETDLVRELVPGMRVITTGVDFPVFDTIMDPIDQTVLMVASDNPMNTAGLKGFLQFAWPAVRRCVPAARLLVVGSVGSILSGAESGVTALGRVDDLDASYASSRVAINPAIAGTGLKVKTIEAIAHLRPIVIWPSGADGLAPELREVCSIATDWFLFAELVIRHLQDNDALLRLRATAGVLQRLLSSDVIYAELAAILGSVPAVMAGNASDGPPST